MIPKQIVIHHSASKPWISIEEIDSWHKGRGFNRSSLGYYVGYHYVISQDGTITQTRKENEIGCHSIPNDGKIGICLTGHFGIDEPSRIQLDKLEELLEKIKKGYNLTDDNIYGHQELSSTECPGKYLMDWINAYRKISYLKKLILKIQLKKMILKIQQLLKGRKSKVV